MSRLHRSTRRVSIAACGLLLLLLLLVVWGLVVLWLL